MYSKKFVVNLRNKLQIADNKSVCGVSGVRRMVEDEYDSSVITLSGQGGPAAAYYKLLSPTPGNM